MPVPVTDLLHNEQSPKESILYVFLCRSILHASVDCINTTGHNYPIRCFWFNDQLFLQREKNMLDFFSSSAFAGLGLHLNDYYVYNNNNNTAENFGLSH